MLRELTEFILPDKRAPRECEACGQLFGCGASLTGCWCMSVKVQAEVREQLRGKYKNCLCPECLARFAQEPNATVEESLAVTQTGETKERLLNTQK